MVKIPFLSKIKANSPFLPRLPSNLLKIALTLATVLVGLFVVHSTKKATPPCPYPS
jgi:hypothetical protein